MPVDHGRGSEPAPPEKLTAQVFGVHLLVLPDPHQCLMEQGTHVVTDIKLDDPPSDRFLAVCHGHNLLTLQREEKELLALDFRAAHTVSSPPVQLVLNVLQQISLEYEGSGRHGHFSVGRDVRASDHGT
jgi:hypothetical protein